MIKTTTASRVSERSILFFIIVLAVTLTLPLGAVSVLALARLGKAQQASLAQMGHGAAAHAATEVSIYISGKISILQVLATSIDLARGETAEIWREAQNLLDPDGSVFELLDAEGRGVPHERQDVPNRSSAMEVVSALTAGSPRVSDLTFDRAVGEPFVRITVPAMRGTEPAYILSVRIGTDVLSQILALQVQSGGYSAQLVDAVGKTIARASDQRGMSELVRKDLAEPEGAAVVDRPDGSQALAFWHRVPRAEWLVVLGISNSGMMDSLRQSFWMIAMSAVVVFMAATAIVLTLSRALNDSQRRLVRAAVAVGQGRVIQGLDTSLREANIVGGVLASASKKLAENALALREANAELERGVQKRTKELADKASLLEATLENIDQGIVHFDSSGQVRLANRQSAQLIGNLAGTWLLAAEQGVHPHVVEHLKDDGRIVEIRTKKLADGSFVCTYTDVTNRVHDAERLRIANAAAESASKAKSDFLATMSHELRTPLNGILGYADLLRRDPSLSERQREIIAKVNNAGVALSAMLGDLLDLSKIEAGVLRTEVEPFRIRDVAAEAVSIVDPLAASKKLNLQLHVSDQVPVSLLGDKNRIRQVLLNLLNNAIKFTDSGFVRLTIEGDLRDDVFDAVFTVADSGRGIPPDERPLVFEKFFQGEGARQRPDCGAGLGLPISRRLIEAMGGGITIESDGATFSVFRVTLPLGISASSVLQDGQTSPVVDLRPARILVADDSELNSQLLKEMLQLVGHEVICVSTGKQAVDRFEAEQFDLVILDLFMPEMDGIEAARSIRGMQGMKRIVPLIACTATTSPQKLAECDAAGFDGHVSKPVSFEVLLPLIARILGGANASLSSTYSHSGDLTLGAGSMLELLAPKERATGARQFMIELRMLSQIKIAYEGEAEAAGVRSHSLQSAGALFGMPELVDGLRRLENSADNVIDARRALEELQPTIATALVVLSQLEERSCAGEQEVRISDGVDVNQFCHVDVARTHNFLDGQHDRN